MSRMLIRLRVSHLHSKFRVQWTSADLFCFHTMPASFCRSSSIHAAFTPSNSGCPPCPPPCLVWPNLRPGVPRRVGGGRRSAAGRASRRLQTAARRGEAAVQGSSGLHQLKARKKIRRSPRQYLWLWICLGGWRKWKMTQIYLNSWNSSGCVMKRHGSCEVMIRHASPCSCKEINILLPTKRCI